MSARHRESAAAMPLSRCDLAGERLLIPGVTSTHFVSVESLIVMIWHMHAGFPTQRLFHTFELLRNGRDPRHADTDQTSLDGRARLMTLLIKGA